MLAILAGQMNNLKKNEATNTVEVVPQSVENIILKAAAKNPKNKRGA